MYITSNSIRKCADVVFDMFYYKTDEEFNKIFSVNLSNKLIFINGDLIEYLVEHLSKFINMTLIIHASDKTIDYLIIQSILPFCKYIYSENCTCIHTKIKQIPLGFCDINTRILFHHNTRPFNANDYMVDKTKTKLCYINVGTYTNTDEVKFKVVKQNRMNCISNFKGKNWVDIEDNKLPYELFIKKLATYKFSICPVGFGIDTHRFYECAIVGTRPIIISSPLDEMYKHYKPLIVNDWSEVTEELLLAQPDYKLSCDVFNLKYWIFM
jgi:hypothetical protein